MNRVACKQQTADQGDALVRVECIRDEPHVQKGDRRVKQKVKQVKAKWIQSVQCKVEAKRYCGHRPITSVAIRGTDWSAPEIILQHIIPRGARNYILITLYGATRSKEE